MHGYATKKPRWAPGVGAEGAERDRKGVGAVEKEGGREGEKGEEGRREWTDLSNPKQTRPTPASYLSDQTFVFTTRLIKRLPSLYCSCGGEGRIARCSDWGWGGAGTAGEGVDGEVSFVGVSTTTCGHERWQLRGIWRIKGKIYRILWGVGC